MSTLRYRGVFLALALCLSLSASAADIEPGDVLVAGAIPLAIGFPSSVVEEYRSGTLQDTLLFSEIGVATDVAIYPGGSVYAATGARLARIPFSASESPVLGPFTSPEHISVAASGNVYATTRSAPLLNELSPAGVLLRSMPFPVQGASSIDLAADQCTLYYAAAPVIGRFDVCTGTVLSPVSNSLGSSGTGTLRILPDGTLLVQTSAGLRQMTTTGVLLREFTLPGSFVALDPSPGKVWIRRNINGSLAFERINLETGVPEAPISTDLSDIQALAIVGEPRAAFVTSAVPTLVPPMLALLAIVLCALALTRIVP